MKSKTFYYSDPLNDDFAGTDIETKKIPEDYEYDVKNPILKGLSAFAYYCVVKPITYLALKIVYHQRFTNKRAFKRVKWQGAFVYCNHTMLAGDAFIPNNLRMRKNHIIVMADTVSIPYIGGVVKALGATTLPDTPKGTQRYLDFISRQIKNGHSITIFPEAHIWPQYTEIRPFREESFTYPVELNAPVFAVTNTYVKSYSPFRKFKVLTYINGPFFPNTEVSRKEAITEMRNKVYDCMVKNSKKRKQIIVNKYIYVEPQIKEESNI